MQFALQVLLSAGIFAMSVCSAPGTHGNEVTGMHGIGVKTPSAAEVAAATEGLDKVIHMPKGGIFTNGL